MINFRWDSFKITISAPGHVCFCIHLGSTTRPCFLSELTADLLLPPPWVGEEWLFIPFERLLFAEQTLTTQRPCLEPVIASLPKQVAHTLSHTLMHTQHPTPQPTREVAPARGRAFLRESL